MNGIGVNAEHWDLLFIFETTQKLDQQSRRLWSRLGTLEALNILRKTS